MTADVATPPRVEVRRATPRPRSLTWLWFVTAGVLILACAAWWVIGATTRSLVHLEFDAGPVICDGAEVGTAPASDEDFLSPKVQLAGPATCSIRVHVVNDGWTDASIDAVHLPYMVERSAWGLVAQSVSPNGAPGVMAEDGLSVTFPLTSVVVQPGTAELLQVNVDYRPVSTFGSCVTVWASSPIVEISALGVASSIVPDERASIQWQNGTNESCGTDEAAGP